MAAHLRPIKGALPRAYKRKGQARVQDVPVMPNETLEHLAQEFRRTGLYRHMRFYRFCQISDERRNVLIDAADQMAEAAGRIGRSA